VFKFFVTVLLLKRGSREAPPFAFKAAKQRPAANPTRPRHEEYNDEPFGLSEDHTEKNIAKIYDY
jgi:hypothetical protein